MSNKSLQNAKKVKNDEFYTLASDIKNEIKLFKDVFTNKVIFMNCNDTGKNFWKVCYSLWKNKEITFKKLIAFGYGPNAEKWVCNNGKDIIKTKLNGDGDFMSPEGLECLKECDIVLTNPPFSIIKEFLHLIIQSNKKFLIVGPFSIVGYKKIFPYFKESKIWYSYNYKVENGQKLHFHTLDNGLEKVIANWWTNIPIKSTIVKQKWIEKYHPSQYPKYDNYNAIEVSRAIKIPKDYRGLMGVPISFIVKLNTNEFRLIDILGTPSLKGKIIYKRIIIQRI